jgi:hypothetical protein
MKHIVWGVFIGMWMFYISGAIVTGLVIAMLHATGDLH